MPSNCSFADYNCNFTDYGSQTFYIADIENFTLLIDHTLYCPVIGINKNAYSLPGYILNSNGQRMTNLPKPNQIGQVNKSDIVTVGLLLRASGVASLDELSKEISREISLRFRSVANWSESKRA